MGLLADRPAKDVAAVDVAPAGRSADAPAAESVSANLLGLALNDPGRVGPPVIEALQRVAGNRAVAEVIQRQHHPAAPALPAPTNDQIVAEIGSTLGGPFTDYAAFVGSLTTGTFLGHNIRSGVRQEFLVKLADAETKIDDEYTTSGNQRPPNNGISSIGGFRTSAGLHGWGIAIDIDVARNPYVSHEAGESAIDAQTAVAYHNSARFILNSPITSPDGSAEQSVIPALIAARTRQPLNVGGSTGRRDRVAEYYDRLLLESEAMKRYFALMNDQTLLATFLANEWPRKHPNEPVPAADVVTRQMWQDFAALGGAIPRGGPPGVIGFTPPAAATGDRPFNPQSAGQQDPGQGFLTIPREVVLGLSRAMSRWGAIDFGRASGDVQHFDDGDGALGGAITSAKAAAARKIRERAAAAAAPAAGSGSGSGASTPTVTPTVAPTPIQRRKEPGEGSTEGGVYSSGPAPLTEEERLSGPHWKEIADERWGGATPNVDELKADFAADYKAFRAMLVANGITVKESSAYRPPERSYLFHYSSRIWWGTIAPKDVPPMAGVDIIWDHGNVADSRSAAEQLARRFGIKKVAALRSNHNGGTAVDMAMNFSGNTTNTLEYEIDGRKVTRTIKVDDEAIIGDDNLSKTISNIGRRELSKAGADFGVKRALDNDIVHWSRSGH